LPEDESELAVSNLSSQGPPRRSQHQVVIESATQLRAAQGKLKTAEERCERIEALVNMALKAKKAGNEGLERAHQADA
jgi:hypothetical protein